MSEHSIILYGAGENARKNLIKWEGHGLIPVCFVDSNLEKHHSYFEDTAYEILPLLEAITRYPNYILYCTQIKDNLRSVFTYLTGLGIPASRIRYAEMLNNMHWHCKYLDNNYFVIDVNPDKQCMQYSYCCAPERKLFFCDKDSIDSMYNKNLDYIADLRNNIASGALSDCYGCQHLVEDIRTSTHSRYEFNLSSGLKGGNNCNFRCVYCTYGTSVNETPICETVDVIEILRFIEKNFEAKNVIINYACGEISVSQYRNEIFEIWENNQWHGVILTNGSIYINELAHLMSKRLITMQVSLDSGKRESFNKIKGADCFEKVKNNLLYYHKSGGDIQLKYIILDGKNDDAENVDGFLEIANSIEATVLISRDSYNRNIEMSRNEFSALFRLINGCLKAGRKLIFTGMFGNNYAVMIDSWLKEFEFNDYSQK